MIPSSGKRFRLFLGAAALVVARCAIADDWPGLPIGPPPKVFEMVKVPGGCFRMGDFLGVGDANERPAHRVCLADFQIGQYPVSQMEWIMVMGRNPSANGACGGFCPVENVSFDEVQDFLRRLNARGGPQYRLPTEAEWEYAARSGGKPEPWAGTRDVREIGTYAWFIENAAFQTHPVGTKKANGLGLYDMTGNVWQWTADRYDASYYAVSPAEDPSGPADGRLRVVRGGYWGDPSALMRTTRRVGLPPEARSPGYGFRLVQSTP